MGQELAKEWICSDDTREVMLDRLVRDSLGGISWSRARQIIATSKITVNGNPVRDPSTRVHAGDKVAYNPHGRPFTANRSPLVPILHIDSQIVVVNKPTGISMVPFDKNEHGTLYQRVRQALGVSHRHAPAPLHVVHRIDKQTSGVVVFARTHSALLGLKRLFRVHDIERKYLAIVHGTIHARTFRSRLIADRGDGKRGSTFNSKLGREAITHVQPLETFTGATLVQCTLETGRTHQIRIHLAEAGFPLFGERVYARDPDLGFEVPRLLLHAKTLGFVHPQTNTPQVFSAEIPEDMTLFLRSLRRGK